ncbi:uncharacterized protein TNCV_2074931 [Trichonephila clavipes]|nr:uncharacterized protein TNCV_2074931 [Trichonephila clavipes]
MGEIERENKRKRTSGSNESSNGLRQQPYKKKRIQGVRRCKGKVPSSLSERPERKRRSPIREAIKRKLTSSTTSTEQVKKRGRRTKENFGQVPAEDSRSGPEEERSFQSSRIQQGRSNTYHLRSRRDITRKASSLPSGRTVQAQEGPVSSRRDQFKRPSPYHFRHRLQFTQDRQDPDKSPRSLRSTSLEVIMSGGPTRDRDIETFYECHCFRVIWRNLVYELASESNESFIQSSVTVLPATSGESAMIQMSEPNQELESETMCDSENQVQGVHLRESFIDLDPGKWVFPVNDSQRHDLIQNGPNQDLEISDESYPKDANKRNFS